MSYTQKKKWHIKPLPHACSIHNLTQKFNLPAIVSTLLLQKKINTPKKVKQYFKPSLAHLHDPFLMKDMTKAVQRIIQAINQKQNILCYGDYDVDGVTSIALVYQFFKKVYPHLSLRYYIPDRNVEGYGISQKGVLWAKAHKIDLIISFDCGIRAVDTIAFAQTHAIDVIVTDHHNAGDILPAAYAIVNPKQPQCLYPFKGLSGCGVAFKLLQAFCQKQKTVSKVLEQYLDLVAISIAADIVPMIDENRIMAYFGLQKLSQKPSSVGLEALASIAGIRSPITVSQIVFQLAPRLNAPGRIAHAQMAVELLITQNDTQAMLKAKALQKLNSERKKLDTQVTKEALEMIKHQEYQQEEVHTHVLIGKTWPKGILGIVAARCTEKYSKPTIVFTTVNDQMTGSARSIPGFDIYQAIVSCEALLAQYGGHAYAAGLTMPASNAQDFIEKFEAVAQKNMKSQPLVPTLAIDLIVVMQQLNHELYDYIEKMAPFGPDNMRPVLATDHVMALSWHIIKEKHLKIHFYLKEKGYLVEGIGFDLACQAASINFDQPLRVAYTLEKNAFLGDKHIQINIKDIQQSV